jgi:hypothetical protein
MLKMALSSKGSDLNFLTHDDMACMFTRFNKPQTYTNINCMCTISTVNRVETLSFFISYNLATQNVTNESVVKQFTCNQAYYNENKKKIVNKLLFCGKLGKCYFSDVMNMVEKHFTYDDDSLSDNSIGSVSILIDHLKQCKNACP